MNKNRLFEHITRSVLRRLTLNEADSRIEKVKSIIRSTFSKLLNVDDVVTSSTYYVNNNPDTTWGEYLYHNLRHSFELMGNSDVALLRFIAPIAYSDEVKFDIDDSKATEQNKLKEIVLILKDKNNGVFEKVKGKDLSYTELCEIVEPIIQQKKQQEEEELANGNFTGGGDYDILEDVDYETAKKYGDMSCSNSKICYTQGENTWDGYKRKGKNKCYILLRKGWQNVEEKHTEPLYDFLPYDAYDEYGLSMIFVFVDPNNDIATCNTRWNHHAVYGKDKGCDSALNKVDLSKILGVSFNSVFSGYTLEDGVVLATFENAQELLDNGHSPKDIFDACQYYSGGFAGIMLKRKCNIIDNRGRILSKTWFDGVNDFIEGFSRVSLEGGYNLMDREGNLISEKWFESVGNFYNGLCHVKSDGQYNYLDKNGNLISEEWFESLGNFYNDLARVKQKGKWNLINREGDIVFENGFDFIEDPKGEYILVKSEGKYNWIDKQGNFLYEQGFDNVGQFDVDGICVVRANGKTGYINSEYELLNNELYDDAYPFKDGFGLVSLNGKWNYIDAEGNYLSDKWFEEAYDFRRGFAEVVLDGEGYELDREGKLHNW